MMQLAMEFLNACARWSDSSGVAVAFESPYEGAWEVKIVLRDSYGPFSEGLSPLPRKMVDFDGTRSRPQRPETEDEYRARVYSALSRLVATMRSARHKANRHRLKHLESTEEKLRELFNPKDAASSRILELAEEADFRVARCSEAA